MNRVDAPNTTIRMDISLSSDALDFDWHPRDDAKLCAVALISGKVQLIDYHHAESATQEGREVTKAAYKKVHTLRPSKKSARALMFEQNGSFLWSASKDGSLSRIDITTGTVTMQYLGAHEAAPSRLLSLSPNLLASGDDDGVVRLWDPRRPAVPHTGSDSADASTSSSAVRTYHHHFDWITELLWFDHLEAPKTKSRDAIKEEEKRKRALLKRKQGKRREVEQKKRKGNDSEDDEGDGDDELQGANVVEGRSRLVCTSGDGTLSVIDVRAGGQSSKVPTTAVEVSEDQEDELLSVVAVKGGKKLVVGTQQGMLSLWAPSRGLLDHVDRIPGHPASVDALCSLDEDTVLTGSADGLIRVVQILPHKFLGVVADHGGMPVERIRRKGRWVASLGHEARIRVTDVQSLLDDDAEEHQDEKDDEDKIQVVGQVDEGEESSSSSDDSDGRSALPLSKKGRVLMQRSRASDTGDDFFGGL